MTHMAPFRSARTLALVLAAFVLCSLGAQRLKSADNTDKETAELVAKMLPQHHLNRTEIDDQMSGKWLDKFLKDLDPRKLYFLQANVDVFNKNRTFLDDQIKLGNVNFCYQVFNEYKNRVALQTEMAHKLIDSPQDFTIDETMTNDPDTQIWAKDQSELDERWRKWVKFDLLNSKLDNETTEKTREKLHKRYRNIKRIVDQMHDIDKLESYLTALTMSYDPHSTYMSPHSWEDFEIQMKLSLDGIGASLKSDDGYTVVFNIVPGGAAAKDGRLKPSDKVLAVGQETGEMEDVFEVKLSDVVRKIRGKRGTKVRLQVRSEGSTESHMIDLIRQKIELTESEVKGEIIDANDRVKRKGKIGVVKVPSFYRDFEEANNGGKSATVDLANVLDKFNQVGVEAVIIDLRDNGGGALTEAIDMTGLFIDKGPVVQVKEPGKVKALSDETPGALFTAPLVVICNRNAASASEIFAGAIKDYRRGIIVGDTTTHGKGTVQNLMDVVPKLPFRLFKGADRGKLKLTIQQFYRVNGESTQNKGVPSDIVLPSIIDHLDHGESFLDNALPFDKIDPVQHALHRFVSGPMVATLQKQSEQRVAADTDFQKVNAAVTRFLERKKRKAVSLKEETLRQEREADKADKADKEKEGDDEIPLDPKGPIFPKGFYNDELMNITVDYISAYASGLKTVGK